MYLRELGPRRSRHADHEQPNPDDRKTTGEQLRHRSLGSSVFDAEVAVERILALLEKDLYLPARDLATKALERFPNHPRLKAISRVFNPKGRSWIAQGGPEPGRGEEFEWLRNPPEWARGKWVALVGSEAVAVGETLKEVAESVRGQELSRRPLVHRID